MGSIESNETVVGGIDGAPHLFASPKRAMRKIGANLAFSTALNLVPIVPTTTAALDPATDVLAHNHSSIFVVVSSALPRWKSKTLS